ncbi:MAG: Y4bD/Y4pK family protein [Candidatus Omnitrophica bacterium]|nr:Y4bD/Y4pK family protein [Candidatus Omnitrophota bacterium]
MITHPFHPLYGQKFEFITYRKSWGEDKVFFYDCNGDVTSIPARWTDVPSLDPFVEMSAGRSLFRGEDLINLCRLIQNLKQDLDKEGQKPCVK